MFIVIYNVYLFILFLVQNYNAIIDFIEKIIYPI